MKFKPYPKYKDSGLEWLGDVPDGWNILALKFIVSMQSGEQITAESIRSVGDYPVFGGNGVRGYTSSFTHNGFYALIGRQGALCGNINYASGKFWASEHAVVVSPIVEGQTFWLGELLRSMNLGQYSITAAQPGLSVDAISKLRIPLPSPNEQSAIATFIERETAKIDTLIAKQEKLIDLLKEKRQAVISHAVTKGLDPTVPMKPSGVEWLGDVPEHWIIKRLKHISPEQVVGIVVNPSEYVVDEGKPFIYGGDIHEGWINLDTKRRINDNGNLKNSKSVLHSGDLVTVRVGAPGITAVVPPELDGGNCASVMVIRRSPNFSSSWLCYAMNSRSVRCQVEIVQYGAAQEQFNISHAVNFIFAAPQLSEQVEIVKHLDKVTDKIDTLIAKAQQAIALQKEHRTALISAAVTGKIDVRNIACKAVDKKSTQKFNKVQHANI